ncbi:hypothetical protein ASZ90_006387 [hydrocarbon metagenome]|uniref:Uncharacterized protein n=1 Tax=hydrocarbon metagenome TaxID=938273 RepID=A0A0W8FSC0_9ZZZZ
MSTLKISETETKKQMPDNPASARQKVRHDEKDCHPDCIEGRHRLRGVSH